MGLTAILAVGADVARDAEAAAADIDTHADAFGVCRGCRAICRNARASAGVA